MKGATSSRGSFFLHDSRWKRKHFPVLKWTLAALCDSYKEALGEGTDARVRAHTHKRCIFARSQNWVNCRRVKRSERGKQTDKKLARTDTQGQWKEIFAAQLSWLSRTGSLQLRVTALYSTDRALAAASTSFQLSWGCSADYMLCWGIKSKCFRHKGDAGSPTACTIFCNQYYENQRIKTWCKSMHFAFSHCTCRVVTLQHHYN